MRLIIFFDLPVDTKKARQDYSSFRNYLIKQGYIMMQYSIYSKIFNNQDAVDNHLKIISKKVPKDGSIRALCVTEKQYSKIIILLGGESLLEKKTNINPIIEL